MLEWVQVVIFCLSLFVVIDIDATAKANYSTK